MSKKGEIKIEEFRLGRSAMHGHCGLRLYLIHNTVQAGSMTNAHYEFLSYMYVTSCVCVCLSWPPDEKFNLIDICARAVRVPTRKNDLVSVTFSDGKRGPVERSARDHSMVCTKNY